jgi:hypothetical protein
MKRSRLTLVPEPLADDLSFPPPFEEQAKYLKLADDFLALRSAEEQWTEGKGNPLIRAGVGERRSSVLDRPIVLARRSD